MPDTNIESNDQQLTPKIADKYADYYDMNNETAEETGIPEAKVEEQKVEKTVDDKQEVKEPSTVDKQVHKPAWQKRIDKQTAKIRQLEAQLSELASVKEQNKELPKYKRDNFVSEEEYDSYVDKRNDQMFNKKLAEVQERNLLNEKRNAEEEAFNSSWQEKVQHNFDGDQEGYTEFADLIRQNAPAMNKWHQDIHDYMEGTEYGPRMMQVMFYRPDIVDQINTAKPIVRMKLLSNLESDISNVMNAKPTEVVSAKPAVSKAPAPIGTIGTSGNVLSDDESEDVAYQRYMKKKFGGK